MIDTDRESSAQWSGVPHLASRIDNAITCVRVYPAKHQYYVACAVPSDFCTHWGYCHILYLLLRTALSTTLGDALFAHRPIDTFERSGAMLMDPKMLNKTWMRNAVTALTVPVQRLLVILEKCD